MALEHGWLRRLRTILSCLTQSEIEGKKKEFWENFGLDPKLIDDSKKDPRKRRNTMNIQHLDSKKDPRKRRKTTNFQPVDHSEKASFRFKMDDVTVIIK